MLRGLLCVAILMCALCASFAQPAKLNEDALLQRRITMWLKMEPMRDALRQIGKQTGVALRCQDAIAEAKVAIFVEDRPAHEILTQLAKLFRYEWRKNDDGGYTLYAPDDTRLQEEKIANLVREARRKAIQELIQAARAVRKMSLEQREKELEALEETTAPLTPQQQVYLSMLHTMMPLKITRQAADGEWVETGERYFPPTYSIYHCLATLPDRAIEALLDGQTIGFSTKPAQGVFMMPNDALLPEWMRDSRWVPPPEGSEEPGKVQNDLHNPEFAGVWLRLATRLNMLEYELVSLQTMSEGATQANNKHHPLKRHDGGDAFSIVPYLQEGAFWRDWEAWATPQKQLLERFPERVEQRKEEPAPKLPQYRSSYGLSLNWATPVDALEQLAWATRRPVISDAFRLVITYVEPGSLLAPRKILEQLGDSCWLRVDESGYLLARHRHYWAYRRYEFPEAWLRPLEQKYEQQGWLSLDDYIALASKLTDLQVEYLTQGRHSLSMPLVRFEFEPLVACLPALRFLASLSAAQRQLLSSGDWLAQRRLTPVQQRRFRESVDERFPPAQQLFREPLPEGYSSADPSTQNLLLTYWAIDYPSQLEEPLSDKPAVRLRTEPEAVRPFVLSSRGSVSTVLNDDPETTEDSRRYVQRELEEDPGARLMAARLRSTLIEFVTERGERKAYHFVLSRFEPYTLPEPKPKKEEP